MAVVFGTPHSRRVDIVHASQTLSILCVKSLTEDDYGQVARSVPVVIRTHTSAITAISNFLATLQPSWTDVDFSERDRRVREVEELVDVLKASLEGVVLAFGEYADAVGVTKKELREAKEALGSGMEMRHV
jgi:nucleoporin NDC1